MRRAVQTTVRGCAVVQ